jgi:tellurite resistance protein TerC
MKSNIHLIFWVAFIVIYLVAFVIDMYVTNHHKGETSVKSALRWTGFWILLAVAYGVAIYFFYPAETVISGGKEIVHSGFETFRTFFTGYLTEYALSVDNLFVFIIIFSLMGVSSANQPRLLKLSVLLTVVLRIAFICAGIGLIQKFNWIMYVFGAVLLYTAIKIAFTNEEDQVNPEKNLFYRIAAKMFPIDSDLDSPHFFTRLNGKRHITMGFLVFLVIGTTNVVFAFDSIPAIFGIINGFSLTDQNFIAITSNVFAVMGLVSLYFALNGIMGYFRFLKQGVSFILFFIALKMLMGWYQPVKDVFEEQSWISLAVIFGALILSILLSIVIKEKEDIDVLKDVVDKEHLDLGILKEQFAKEQYSIDELMKEINKKQIEIEQLKLELDQLKNKQ